VNCSLSLSGYIASLPNRGHVAFHQAYTQQLSSDIVDFYPSITKELLDKVISWAKTITSISDDHVPVIKHARKSLLFHQDKTWVKRNTKQCSMLQWVAMMGQICVCTERMGWQF
jgi:hypothetical protein